MEAGMFVGRLLQWSRWKMTVAWARMAAQGALTRSQILDIHESQAKRIDVGENGVIPRFFGLSN